MLGFFKNLLRNPLRASAERQSTTVVASPPPATPVPSSHAAPQSRLAQMRKAQTSQNGRGVELPVQSILANLPLELQPKIRLTDVGELTITVPLEKILAQLSRGAVKISFGELRQAVPEVFTTENDRDRVLVSLPLGDILSRLNPNLITRRRVQRQVQVPAEVASPFDDRHGLVFSVGPSKTEAPSTPVARQTTVGKPSPVAPARSTLTKAPTPAPPSLTPPAPPMVNFKQAPPPVAPTAKQAPAAPVAKPTPAAPVSQPLVPDLIKMSPPSAAPVPAVAPVSAAAAPAPVRPVAPVVPRSPALPKTAEPVTPNGQVPSLDQRTPAATVPAASVPQPAKPAPPGECLLLPLTSMADGWADAIRKEIVELSLVDAKVALPVSAVEQSLKQGRIAFSWKLLRSWIKPAVLPTVSAHDGTVLELPLKVVAPMFLARQRNASKTQQKVAVDEDIPNLFFGFPQPEPAAPVAQTTARPSDTNFYVWGDSNDRAKVDESDAKRGPTPGTKFVAKYATPNEVVSRASALDGVTGVLIALPDGLMVANRLPPEVNADTLAAFLPQIFGKVSQCTKELRMGDLNNLNFTVGNVPWKIFRVNAIFFAAFGRAGEPLPTAQLAALAAELDHKPK
jgi:predicted regulator of Ras-like GTPase activity (Roadblock/LC7/MglB family)